MGQLNRLSHRHAGFKHFAKEPFTQKIRARLARAGEDFGSIACIARQSEHLDRNG